MKDYPYMYSKRYVLLITEMCLKNLEIPRVHQLQVGMQCLVWLKSS